MKEKVRRTARHTPILTYMLIYIFIILAKRILFTCVVEWTMLMLDSHEKRHRFSKEDDFHFHLNGKAARKFT